MQKRKLKLQKKGYPFGDPLMKALGRVNFLEQTLQGQNELMKFQREEIRELKERLQKVEKVADDLTREKHKLQQEIIKLKRRYVSLDEFT